MKSVLRNVIRPVIGKSSGSAWTPASLGAKGLYWGKISEISGGHMPNKMTGATDYLTVSGAVGSETYQCPQTTPYKNADYDFIWIADDGVTWNTVSSADLIGFDLQRTPIKYLDDSPNSIKEIIILKAGEILTSDERNYLFKYMRFHPLWDDLWNDYGYVKSNRSIEMLLHELQAPSNIILTQDGASVKIDWTSHSTIEGSFGIARSTIDESGYSVIHTVNAGIVTWTDGTVVESTKYYYKVYAISNTTAHDSAYCISSNITTPMGTIYYIQKQDANYTIADHNTVWSPDVDFLSGGLTFAMWCKGNNPTGGIFQYFGGKLIFGSVSGRYGFYCDVDNKISVQAQGTVFKNIVSTVLITDQIWHFLLMRISAGGVLEFKIDNQTIGTPQTAGNGSALANPFKFYIGAGNNSNGSAVTSISKINWARPIIYMSALTDGQCTSLYQLSPPIEYYGYWKTASLYLSEYLLDESTGQHHLDLGADVGDIKTTGSLP